MTITPESIDQHKHDVAAFIRRMAERHNELRRPVNYGDLLTIAEREGVRVRIVRLSRPARLIRVGNRPYIQLDIKLTRTQRALYGMHEMCHFWRDDPGESCYYAEAAIDSDAEDFADLFAWVVTSPARVFFPGIRDRDRPRGVRWPKPKPAIELPPIYVPATEKYSISVAGASFQQEQIENIYWKISDLGFSNPVPADLIPEDNNLYDSLAVRVEIWNRHVGYLSREDARRYRAAFGNRSARVEAKIVEGFENTRDSARYGVRLDVQL